MVPMDRVAENRGWRRKRIVNVDEDSGAEEQCLSSWQMTGKDVVGEI